MAEQPALGLECVLNNIPQLFKQDRKWEKLGNFPVFPFSFSDTLTFRSVLIL